MDRDQVIDVLGRTSLFGGLHRDLLDSLASACVQRVYRRDQYLWYQGDPGDRLVVVASGLVKVVVHSEAGDQIVLAALGPPESRMISRDHGSPTTSSRPRLTGHSSADQSERSVGMKPCTNAL